MGIVIDSTHFEDVGVDKILSFLDVSLITSSIKILKYIVVIFNLDSFMHHSNLP